MQPIPTSATFFSRSKRSLTMLLVLALSLGTLSQASAGSGFFNDYIIVTGTGTPNASTYYYHANGTGNAAFQGANLGTYDRNSGSLVLEGGQAHTFESGDVIKDSTQIFFRLYRQTAANGDAGQGYAFQGSRLPQTAVAGNSDRTFENTNIQITRPNATIAPVNLVQFTSGPGVYVVEVYFQAVGTNGSTRFHIYDSNSNNNYKATFTISSTDAASGTPLVGQPSTMWLGGVNPGCLSSVADSTTQTTSLLTAASEWFDPLNWSNGVPTRVTNTEIPNYDSNSCVVYPNIRATAQTGSAYVNNLTMDGNNAADRSILRLVNGNLYVYGNITNPADSYIQRSGTTIILAGTNQSFDGSQTYYNFTVDGGGTKTLSGSMKVLGTLRMINGILVTGTANPTNTNVTLDTGAQITGESATSYVKGILLDAEVAQPGVLQNFGGIGLDLTFTSGTPGNTRVTRTTGFSAAGLLGSKPGIKRTFGIQPSNANSPTNVLIARIGVRYLDIDGQGVYNAQAPTPQNLDETQYTIWYSTSGGAGFSNAGRDRIDPTNNRVTQNGLTTFATTTLGENPTPLPVNFLYFTAGRQGSDAILTWGTAQEKDNAGYEVQASTDGIEFHTITTVKPTSPNSSAPQHYSYLDSEGNNGIVYYRLKQIDTDGIYAITPVRVVDFGAESVEASTSSVFPNPFKDGDQLMLSVQSNIAGDATMSVSDILGRQVAYSTVALPSGGATLPLPSLNGKPAGIYLVHMALPSGTTKTVKVQKQ